MLKLTANKIGDHYGLSERAVRHQLSKLGLSLNNVPDMVRLVLFNEFKNRQRKDKSIHLTTRKPKKLK